MLSLFEAVLQQEVLAFFIDSRSPVSRRKPCPTDLRIAVCHVDIAYARGTDDFAGHLFQDSEGDMRSLLFLLQCQADDIFRQVYSQISG